MESTMSRPKGILLLLFVFVVIEFSPQIGTLVANHTQNLLGFLDSDHVFSGEVIHHIVQMLIPLAIMLAWPNRPLKEWGFRLGDSRRGWKWVFWFTLVWLGVYVVITIPYLIQHTIPKVYYDVNNTRNLLGELGFRAFIVGLSEETLFRAFPITVLIVILNRRFNIFHLKISQAGVIAALLFCYAHIGYHIYPFEIYSFHISQLFTAAGLGLLYAVIFEETKSILYPMIIHSVSDVIPVLGVFALQVINH